MRTFRLGTRRSALAMAQSQQVADAITAATGHPVELVPIVSEGDISRASLSQIGGTGVFATRAARSAARGGVRLPRALAEGPADRAAADGLVIAATPVREDARDVVVTRDGTPLHVLRRRHASSAPAPRAAAPRCTAATPAPEVRRSPRQRRLPAAARARRRAGCRDPRRRRSLAPRHRSRRPRGSRPLGLAEWPTAPGQGALAVETIADAADDLQAALAASTTPRRASP